MITALIVAFLLLISATSATGIRAGKASVPRYLALVATGVLAFVFFGYTLGSDLAARDNAAGCHAPSGAKATPDQSPKTDSSTAT
jgi:hypothetical protein